MSVPKNTVDQTELMDITGEDLDAVDITSPPLNLQINNPNTPIAMLQPVISMQGRAGKAPRPKTST